MDLKDKKILTELEMNARVPHSELGKKVGLSKQVVKYRIEKLEKEKYIQGYNAIIDVEKLGETIYLVYLKLIKLSTENETKWTKEIEKNPNIIAVGKNAGNWDLTIIIKCKSNLELDNIIKTITAGKQDKIKEKLITSEIESTYFTSKLLFSQEGKEANTGSADKIKLEETDTTIIHELAKNCRISLVDLASKLKMSANGIKNRIKNLEAKKIIIGYKTKINYQKLDFLHFRVFIHLNKFSDETYASIKQFLKKKGNTESVSRYIGYADIDFRCHTKNITELYQLISDIKDNYLQEIISIDSMIIFNWESINYLKQSSQ